MAIRSTRCRRAAAERASAAQVPRVVYHLSEGLPQASNGLARGVDFPMKDAKDANGNRYLAKEQFIAEVTWVPSGVAEVTRLQQREGFAYLKP